MNTGDTTITTTQTATDASNVDAGNPQDLDASRQTGNDGTQTSATEQDGQAADTAANAKTLQRRLERERNRRHRAEAEAETLRRQVESRQPVRQETPSDPQGEGENTESDVRTQAKTLAQQMTRDQRFADEVATKATSMAKEGEAFHPDFFEKSAQMAEVLPLVDRRGAPTPFALALLDCDNRAALVVHLADNPDVLDELVDLTPRQLERQLDRIADKLGDAKPAPKKTISSAPEPLAKVTGKGAASSRPATAAEALEELRRIRQG